MELYFLCISRNVFSVCANESEDNAWKAQFPGISDPLRS